MNNEIFRNKHCNINITSKETERMLTRAFEQATSDMEKMKLDSLIDQYHSMLKNENANLKQALNDIRGYIDSEEFFINMNAGKTIVNDEYFASKRKIDKIIDKVLGGDK